ncbi:MAG: hypothetical protein ACE5EV_09285 [Gaiellales bacterium]
MSGYTFERECRTENSESYIVELDDEEVGRIDLHFTPEVSYGTLCVIERLSEDDVKELISEVDERLVISNDPFREDFVITVWVGRETRVLSDEDFGKGGEDDLDGDDG